MSGLRENRKVKRIRLDNPLKVVLCSIGAEVKYELTTRDISFNGLFLEFDSPGRFPFNQASIMEVWLELEGQKTVFFNGKMARVVLPGSSTDSGIAIRIVQIDKDNEKALVEFVKLKTNPDGSNIVA